MTVRNWVVAMFVTAFCANTHAAVVFSNGLINGTFGAYDINSNNANQNISYSVSNSFTLSTATLLDSVEIGLWVTQGDVPLSLTWSIGSRPFSSNYGTGVSALSNELYRKYFDAYDVFRSTFAINSFVPIGESWLTLSNATGVKPGGEIAWDANSGPSKAQDNGAPIMQSEYFSLSSRTSEVPEPFTTTLFLIGFVALSAFRKRR